MNIIEIPPFYIGQEVIANCNHPLGDFKKGDEFKVKDIKKGCCSWEIEIGIDSRKKYIGSICEYCDKIDNDPNYYRASRFSPKIEIKDFISMKQLVEEKLELISQN